jgi:hypothetical protein
MVIKFIVGRYLRFKIFRVNGFGYSGFMLISVEVVDRFMLNGRRNRLI